MLVLADSFLQRNGTALGLLGTAVVAAIGWAVAWSIYRKGKRRKHLDYRIISDIPILSSHNRPQELKVVYGPLELKNPRVTEVRFWNTGNQVIDESDFMEKPFRVLPRADAKLLDFNVLERPTDLVEKLEHQVGDRGEYDPGTLLVYAKTLNAGDSFTVQMVYDGGDSDRPPTVEGRVRDETRKPTIYMNPEERTFWRAVGTTMVIAVLGAFVLSTASRYFLGAGGIYFFNVILATVCSILLGIQWVLYAVRSGRFDRS